MLRAAPVWVALSSLLLSTAASAQALPPPPAERPYARPLAVMAQLGFGTPTGYYGLAVEAAPIPEVVLSLGAGMGSGPYCKALGSQPSPATLTCDRWHRDLQVAVQGRTRLVVRGPTAFALGGGYSTGGYTWVELTTDGPAYKSMERAHWANLEASWEGRHESGASVRLFAGYAFLLNPSALACVGWGAGAGSFTHCKEDHAGDGHRLFYLGIALGWAL